MRWASFPQYTSHTSWNFVLLKSIWNIASCHAMRNCFKLCVGPPWCWSHFWGCGGGCRHGCFFHYCLKFKQQSFCLPMPDWLQIKCSMFRNEPVDLFLRVRTGFRTKCFTHYSKWYAVYIQSNKIRLVWVTVVALQILLCISMSVFYI